MSAMERVTVIGAGTMGHGIAQVAAAAGLGVSLHDVSEELIRKGLDAVQANLDQGVEKGFEFVIHRRRQRIADLEVFEVYPDLSGARIKAVYEGQGIRQGDHAYFPLSTRP